VTPGTTDSRAIRKLLSAAATAALVAALGISVAPAAQASDYSCSGDTCDQGLWQAARGVDNEMSYWGMSAGHNCTNYVAWRLIGDGATRPKTNPGDAAEWAANAILDGYPVDANATVGSVAQWDSFAGGNGAAGHVAYVERVNDDGTILVSEDYWHDGDQSGPLTYRTVDASSVSHFIHYVDGSDWLRTGSFIDEHWRPANTGLDPEPTALSAVALTVAAPKVAAPTDPVLTDPAAEAATPEAVAPAVTAPEIFYAQGGKLWQADQSAGRWAAVDTGVRSEATSMSVVTMDGTRPYAMSIDNGVLVMTVKTVSGWQRMSTGFQITGEIAAVNLGGLWPTVYLSQGGALWHIWGDNEGWHSEPTNVEVWGPISAIVNAQGWPEVFNVESGMLFRSWLSETGWQTESTGIPASGRIAAVSTPTGTQVLLVQDDTVFRIVTDGTSWTKWTTGLVGGQWLSAVDLGGAAPVVIQAG
jgi:surface antigen